MGVATVALVYDLTRRLWGRPAGFVAGLALATTPIAVAISRHNNPDALLILCCVGALWATVRGLQDGRTRWVVLAGVCVGLGFETKMAAALLVVPGIVAAWLWVAPRGRLVALRQLLAGGAAMVAVGGAWPLLVALTRGRPPVGVGHERQLDPLADLRLQRPGPPRRPGRRPAGVRRRRGRGRRPVRRSSGRAAAARLLARRAGGLAARLRARRRPRHRGREPPPPRGRAHRLADRRRRCRADLRGRLQRRLRHLPPLLRLPARAVRGRPGRRRRGAGVRRAG